MPEQPLPTMATFFLANLSTEWLIGAMVSCLGATDDEGHEKGVGSWGRLQLPKKYTGDDLHMSETRHPAAAGTRGAKLPAPPMELCISVAALIRGRARDNMQENQTTHTCRGSARRGIVTCTCSDLQQVPAPYVYVRVYVRLC